MKYSFLFTSLTLVPIFFSGACGSELDDFIYYGTADFNTAPIPWDDSGADLWLPVVTTSFQSDREPARNRTRMAEIVTKITAAYPDTRLIVFAETITGWYYDASAPSAYIRSLAESVSGETTELAKDLAQSHNIYIAFGFAEKKGGRYYNNLSVVDPTGKVLGSHRKRNLTAHDKASGYSPGDRDTVIEIDGIKVGLLICMDRQDTVLAGRYARDDVKIIIHSIADSDNEEIPFNYVARAYNKWFVMANRYGTEGEYYYDGIHSISDPAGTHRYIARGGTGYGYHRIGVYQ